MKGTKVVYAVMLLMLLGVIGSPSAHADIFIQCPNDTNGDGIVDSNDVIDPNVVCMHIAGGDGFVKMGDGRDMYILGFSEVALGTSLDQVMVTQVLKASAPAPLIELQEGQELYLTLSNVGMNARPDLFDPHSVHWHGFPNAAPIFDGLPEPSPTPNMGQSFTYYYNAQVPGTYLYHCHVEASEHMQMGMIGNLWVKPKQDGTTINGYNKFAYNDVDGSTGYDVAFPVQMTAFDSVFHDAHEAVQPLPFAYMDDDYPMINGRGYPATVNPGVIANKNGDPVQPMNAIITAAPGQRILLRVSNVSTTHLYSIATTMGLPMKVVGRGAEILRGPGGLDLYYDVNVLNVAGGQAYDVIIEVPSTFPTGTYFLYSTNLARLANGPEERGGIMTEIRIN